jgi:tetratricopeptide (TPR) repeat protein
MAEESRNALSQEMANCLDWPDIKQKYPQIDYWTLNVLLQVYADTGNLDSSIQSYQQKLNVREDALVDLNNLAVLYWRKQNYLKSLQYITQAIALDSANAILHYNLGMLAKKMGDSLSASGEFEKAKELDFYSLRTKKAYNDKLKLLAQQQEIPLVDLDSIFLADHNEFLFIDHCHPKPEGHRLMAEALLEKFRQTGWMDALNKN